MLVLGILAIVGVVLYFMFCGDARGRADPDALEEELIQLCLGDRKQAERLIALEMKKAPGVARSEAARRALQSLRRDLR